MGRLDGTAGSTLGRLGVHIRLYGNFEAKPLDVRIMERESDPPNSDIPTESPSDQKAPMNQFLRQMARPSEKTLSFKTLAPPESRCGRAFNADVVVGFVAVG